MLKLEQIKPQLQLSGVEPNQVVRIIQVEPMGADAVTLYYQTPDGAFRSRMLLRADEADISVATAGRPFAFDAPGADFKLAVEAHRINLAHLFDPMMAVHTSNVDPLPHQITAVYESMLPRQPLRYVLADDPGAGKTIMAGLLIRELIMRADAQRILIVSPGSLVEQWQDEMREKFGLDFKLFSRELIEQYHSGNPFNEVDLLVARLDQLSRSEELQAKLKLSHWDLIVVDEAHKLSASWFGKKINRTKRFELGTLLGSITRHFLLMTATPHNGKEADFQLFMSLIDSDRFSGKFREGVHKVDVQDVMRRMVKEDLLKFDGTRLFPERKAYTVNYSLSPAEKALYEAVTKYVQEEFQRADRLGDQNRGNRVGFALASLQRRLASSPEAIYQSLSRRRKRLQDQVEELRLGRANKAEPRQPADPWEMDDDLSATEYEEQAEEVTDQATAAQTIPELEAEIRILEELEQQAQAVRLSKVDRKWDELRNLLQNTPEMRDSEGQQRKLIIFTEHRDTLNYLTERIQGTLGNHEAVVTIHGGTVREERRAIQDAFRNDPVVRVLIATDAAGEGVNLQNANLMVNYDLPWNPNRMEQRFGRIHRIGQTEVCHLWNLVAAETREGYVYQKLLEKLNVEREALGGRVFDILGEVFEETSLKELLIRAIRYGEDPEVRASLHRVVEGALDTERIREILDRHALAEEVIDQERLYAVKAEMERAEARKLQPYFIRSFFTQAFGSLGGELRPREAGRFEIKHVPAAIRERNRQLGGRSGRIESVQQRYERVCFEKQYVRIQGKSGAAMASLLHPGHPLMQAITDLMLEQHRKKLKQGAILVDPTDVGLTPRLLFLIDHAVNEGSDPTRNASRRLQFVEIDPTGKAINAGWAPHLDLAPINPADLSLVRDLLDGPWLAQNLEKMALDHASNHLAPEHYAEVKARREAQVTKTLNAVHARLVTEINYQSNQILKHREAKAAGKEVRLALETAERAYEELVARRETRTRELEAMRHVTPAPPVVLGGALVIPAGLLAQRKGEPGWSADSEARRRVELVAMKAVMDAEQALGHHVIDVSAEKCGWDVTSIPSDRSLPTRHIEVKGRAKGQTTVTVTRNEIFAALNQGDKFILGIVLVDGDSYEGPFYVPQPFTREPDWAETSSNLDLELLLSRATRPN